ncbi:hypothetical protein GOP47_0015509 [Adiantum capillus-veneris]|uniref:U3 small nucleolar RNA-associated protein 13 C-terminal domain-containing protein n=1 Tax=Adiantum capillus-veneris TaxID=13818 RepID=A0A9D4UJS0_ADICA|nr:hypothetical protein GOP47_0015509 [Adiantum capillus-veneris]
MSLLSFQEQADGDAEFLEVSDLRELIEGILPYTEWHFSRLNRLHRSTFLLDYTLASMAGCKSYESITILDLLTHTFQV